MADVRDFRLPDLGEGLEEGEVVAWLVGLGDAVALNQEIVTVETAKAAVDVPSPFEGTLVERLAEEGETLEVGSVLCRIEVAGDTGGDGDDDGAGAGEAGAGPGGYDHDLPDDGGDADDDDRPTLGSGGGGSTGLDAEGEPQPLVGYGSGGAGGGTRRRRRGRAGVAAATDVGAAAADEDAPSPAPDGAADDADAGTAPSSAVPAREGRPLAKPPVRKLAKDLGIDLADVAGSGEDGIITREDVHAHAEGADAGSRDQPAASGAGAGAGADPAHAADARPTPAVGAPAEPSAPAPALHAVAAGEKPVPGFRGRTPGEVEQVRGIRRTIIEKMERSRREIPHALAAADADVTELWRLRDVLTEQARQDGVDVRVSANALVMRATVMGLRRFPTLNAVYDAEAGEIRLLEHVNLGVAVDTDRGLVVANVKDAHACSTLQLAQEAARLAGACRDGTATPAELTGGTFTTDNYGYFGNDDGNPIINAPEVGILGIGVMRERPWVVDGELAVRRVCRFQLAFDHRVCDGGEAGRFVRYVADLCEQPARILLHA